MRKLCLVLLGGLLAGSGCGDHHDDDNDIGFVRQGETVRVSVFGDTDSFPLLDECEEAEVVEIRRNGRDEDFGENIDAFVVGIVEKHLDDCETDIEITANEDAVLDDYTIEVEFTYKDIDDFRGRTSGFVYLEVVRGRTPTPTS